MISREDLERKYAGYTNFELLEVLENNSNYTTLAVDVAREELKKRNVSESELEAFEEEQESQAGILANKYFEAELSIWQKLFFYIIFVPLLHFPIKQNLRDDGYVLKTRQAGYYSICGFVLALAASFISIGILKSDSITLVIWLVFFLAPLKFDEYFNKARLIKEFEGEVGRKKKGTSEY